MNLKQQSQQLNNNLDKLRSKLSTAKRVNDLFLVSQLQLEIKKTQKKLNTSKKQQATQTDDKASLIKAMAFNRALTKLEQADMGKLKKSVKGLVVVHPLTAIGKEMAIKQVTGFAPKSF